MESLDLNVVYTAGPSLQSLLGNPKDKVNRNEKSGIYEINCKDCNQKYIGQTKRPIITRFKEHMAHRKFGRFEKSSAAQHIFESDHRIHETNLKLVRSVNNCKFLNIFESIEIFKNKDRVLNADGGPIPSTPLYTLLPKVVVDINSNCSYVNS
jgi:hypothetical protein